jgi:hypothetical protein
MALIDLLTDEEVFYGPWSIEVIRALSGGRLEVRNSDSLDGIYRVDTVGPLASITGDGWIMRSGIEGNNGEFLPGRLLRSGTFDVEKGLQLEVDMTLAVISLHFSVRLLLRSEDPDLNPIPGHPPDFTIPEDSLVE